MKRPLIGLAISAVCFVLSFGLCGMAGTSGNTNSSNSLVYAGLVFLGASILGGIVSLIWLVVALIQGKN